MIELSEEIRSARRAVCLLKEFELLEDLSWNAREKKWVLHFRLNFDSELNTYIPRSTNWYVLISDQYPFGDIQIFPDKVDGIVATFPHQNFNSEGDRHIPWRKGLICVNSSGNIWGRTELRTEPYEPELRLYWHVQRAIDWLQAAATGLLQRDGDPFELPPFPKSELKLLAFNEDPHTFQQWQQTQTLAGLALVRPMPGAKQILAVHTFITGQSEIKPEWGTYIESSSEEKYGIWFKMPRIPVLTPWQIPETWDQLFCIGSSMGIDLKRLITDMLIKYRSKAPSILLFGFPIADRIGRQSIAMHWFCVDIQPYPSNRGFKDPQAYLKHAVNVLLSAGRRIPWILTQNWHKSQISARGSVHQRLQDSRIVIVGAGAIGSMLAESLLRLGCGKMTIVDADVIEIGNLCRHTLTMRSIWQFKAAEIAVRLNTIFPYAAVDFYSKKVEQLMSSDRQVLDNADIIIEVTGDDDVLRMLMNVSIDNSKKIISVSTDVKATRLYCYVANRAAPPESIMHFFEKLQPWLKAELTQIESFELPMEHVGCWHPISPARIDDLLMLINAGIKPLEKAIEQEKTNHLIIVEKTLDEYDNFNGIKINYE